MFVLLESIFLQNSGKQIEWLAGQMLRAAFPYLEKHFWLLRTEDHFWAAQNSALKGNRMAAPSPKPYALVSMPPPFKTDQYWHTHTKKTNLKNTNHLIGLNKASVGSARTYFASLDLSSVTSVDVRAAWQPQPEYIQDTGGCLGNDFSAMCQEILSWDAASLSGSDGGDGYPSGPTLLFARKALAVKKKSLLHRHVSISASLSSWASWASQLG